MFDIGGRGGDCGDEFDVVSGGDFGVTVAGRGGLALGHSDTEANFFLLAFE